MYQKKLNLKVDFLKTLPLLKSWNRDSLVKLSFIFKEQKYKRNHIVFKQGEDCDKIFIVAEGEFEATKQVKIPTHKDKECKFIEDYISQIKSENIKIQQERFKDIQMFDLSFYYFRHKNRYNEPNELHLYSEKEVNPDIAKFIPDIDPVSAYSQFL